MKKTLRKLLSMMVVLLCTTSVNAMLPPAPAYLNVTEPEPETYVLTWDAVSDPDATYDFVVFSPSQPDYRVEKTISKADLPYTLTGSAFEGENFYLSVRAHYTNGSTSQWAEYMHILQYVHKRYNAIQAEGWEMTIIGVKDGVDAAEIARLVAEEHSEGLYHNDKLVGCVKRAHDIDANLSAHVMHENIVSKASSVLALLSAVKSAGIAKEDVEYVVDCCEEACGDMNQRGGGNFAKAAAEIAGLVNASGSDVRGFCAGPAHAIIDAASLVASGAFKTVIVTAGGCTAKLGMNGKDHVKKDLPILEDMLGGFAVVISQDDGVSPEFNFDMLGRHTVGTGTAPQEVTNSLVFKPLEDNGFKAMDIGKYAGELHNSEILKPAGGGDPALQFFKVVAATAIKRGEMEKAQMLDFISGHGMTGWAPTQGHIPSGVPYLGFAREDILSGKIERAMIVGKGSLFLGRLTNLFDGVSFVVQKNSGAEEAGVSEDEVKGMIAKAMKEFAATLMAAAE